MEGEIVQAIRVLRYVGTREAVERTLNNSIQGTLVVGRGAGWHNNDFALTIHAAELGRPEVVAVRLSYTEAHIELLGAVMGTKAHLPAAQADEIHQFLKEQGVGLIRVHDGSAS